MRTELLLLSNDSQCPESIAGNPNKKLMTAWVLSCLSLLPFVFFYLTVSSFNEREPVLSLLHIGSAISFLFFWRLTEWGSGKYDTFGAALLLFYAVFKFHAAIDAWVYGARIDEIYYTVPLPKNIDFLFLKSEMLNHFGVLFLVTVWRTAVGRNIDRLSFVTNSYRVGSQLPLFFYSSALFLSLSESFFGLSFGVLNQVSGIIYKFGVVAIFFVASNQISRYKKLSFAFILAVPMVILAAGSGMKEEMMFPLVPALLIFWFNFRSVGLKVLAILVGIVLLAYSQLYVKYVRSVAWGGDNQQYSTVQLLAGFGAHSNTATFFDGVDSISSRINMTNSRAVTVAIADARGLEPMTIFGPIPGSFIPRILWPGKPVMAPGAQQTLRIHNLDAPVSEAWSSTAAGIFSEMYLGGGYIGWFLGVMVYGLLLARIQLYTLRKMPGYGHLTLSILTVYIALRFEEEHVVYAYTGLVFTWIVLLATVQGSMSLLKSLGPNHSPACVWPQSPREVFSKKT